MKKLSELKKGDIISYIYHNDSDIYNFFIDTMMITEIDLASENIVLTTTVLETTSPDLSLIGYKERFYIPKTFKFAPYYNNFLFSNDPNDINLRKIVIISNGIKSRNEEIRKQYQFFSWTNSVCHKTKKKN